MPFPSSRRRILEGIGVSFASVLAGCSNVVDQSDANSPGSSPSSPPGCDRQLTPSIPTPDSDDRLQPRTYPERPEQLSESSVGPFALEFERAFRWNELLTQFDEVTQLSLELLEEPTVSPADDGYVTRFSMRQQLQWRNHGTGTATPILVSGSKEYAVGYFISAHMIKRSQGSGATPTNPHRWGTLLVCSK